MAFGTVGMGPTIRHPQALNDQRVRAPSITMNTGAPACLTVIGKQMTVAIGSVCLPITAH